MKTVKDIDFETFVEAYNHYCIIYIGIHPSDYYKELPSLINIDEFEEDPNGENNIVRGDWKKLAGQLLQRGLKTEDLEFLNNRDIDFIYNRTPHVGCYFNLTQETAIIYWKCIRETSDLTFDIEDVSDNAIDLFNSEQRLLYNIIFNHFFDSLDNVL